MYRLYVIIGNNSYIGRYFDEKDLISSMIEIVNKYHIYNFDIYEVLDNQSYHYRRIIGQEDFENLLLEYKTTKDIEDIPALELKRQILKRIYGGKKC